MDIYRVICPAEFKLNIYQGRGLTLDEIRVKYLLLLIRIIIISYIYVGYRYRNVRRRDRTGEFWSD